MLLVTALGVAGAPAQANAVTGVLSGRVVTDSGDPAADIRVTAQSTDGASQFGRTGADGSYRFDAVEPGQYILAVSPRDGVTQYAHGKGFSFQADKFEVKAGEETVVNETLLPRGNVAGRLVEVDGSPIVNTYTSVRFLDGEASAFMPIAADGTWSVDGMPAGRYEVHFFKGDGTIQQAAFGKVGKAQPDVITVAANATTTVNDTVVARTSIRVTATNALTGAAVTSFSVSVGPRYGFTENGELVVDGIQIGTYDMFVHAEGYLSSNTEVTLTAEGQQHLAVALTPESAIAVKVVDAATGAPIPGFCVGAFNRERAYVGDGLCGEQTDDEGNLKVGRLEAGTYQLFATPGYGMPPGYGAQWVGANGGTGRQLHAKSFTLAVGQTITGTVIKLDRAGTITGRVSTPDGGLPRFGSVNVLSGHPISGSGLGVPVNEDGTYTLDFLGPYDWPLLFEAADQASQWSGHVGDRLFARTVKVNSGATATFDFRFRAGVNVIVKGRPLFDQILLYNAVTGDIMGAAHGFMKDDISELMVGPQLVKLQVWPSPGDPFWVGGSDFAHAKVYWIPGSGSKTIILGS